MKQFMDGDFLLNTETSERLYHSFAEHMPIIDYHCHIDPKDIYENKHYENITQLWLGIGGSNFGDHYKWRLMRSFGIDECYISGSAPDKERFIKFAQCIQRAIGHPLYHWSHMELKKYFCIDTYLCEDNAEEIYKRCSEILKAGMLGVRDIINQSNVKLICTTDDPADDLQWHIKLRDDADFNTQVLPAMRPDKAKGIEQEDYLIYLEKLSGVSGVPISSFGDLKKALSKRMDFFASLGCRVSDHAFEYIVYSPADEAEVERIFAKRLTGEALNEEERDCFYTAFMLFVAEEYYRRGWVMQLHYGCKRNNNTKRYEIMGPDTGFDCVNDYTHSNMLPCLLNAMESKGTLPKTILYSLNPNDNPVIVSIIGCFQNSDAVSKIQQGAAWWFNDHVQGVTDQLVALASGGNLSGFVGMLTDSRSFLSYTRHDYFRRILCRVIGEWVEEGLYPADMKRLESIIKDICYNNAVKYFGFELSCV